MGIELEFIVLLLVQAIGSITFARFEIETSTIRKIAKWLSLDALTLGLFFWIGHWALLVPLMILIVGTTFHFRWCKKNGIDPIKGTPKKKYYELRGWKWEE